MSKVLNSGTGKITKLTDSITGADKLAQASIDAANIQAASGDRAIDFQKESRDIARGDLQPFRQAGQSALPGLQDLVNDPNAQKSFIQDNPFFKALTDKASSTLFANNAAKGKVGSGGTADALQNSLLLLGNDLVNQSIAQKQNLATLGSNAAAGQASISQNSGNSISDLITGQGNALAAGEVGSKQAIYDSRMGILKAGAQAGGAVAACDMRLKTDIQEVGKLNNGLPLYLFRYKGQDKLHINVMAQDVEKVMPHAVIEIDGFKHVKMDQICQ